MSAKDLVVTICLVLAVGLVGLAAIAIYADPAAESP